MSNRFCLILFSVVLFANIIQAQSLPTIKVDGSEVLVSSDGSNFPLWLKSGQSLEVGDNTQFISVLEFNKEPIQGGGNSLIFEDVVIVTTPASTVPNGKVWKVEYAGIDKNATLAGTLISQANNCESPSNIQIVRNGDKTITVSWNAPNSPPAYGYLIAVMPSGVGPTSSNDFVTITGATTYTTGAYSTSSISFDLTDDIDIYIVSSCNLGSQSEPINDNVTLSCNYNQLYSFTNCGKTEREGPTQAQCNNAYGSTSLDGLVTVTSGIQEWTVPTTGVYEFEVAGASSPSRGKGAIVKGIIPLNQGDVLKILVGQRGVINSGSGGSFVALGSNSLPLMVAGGGGGCVNHLNNDGTTKTSGNPSSNGNPGGANGLGSPGDGGGGGFYTNGAGSYSGAAFLNGGIGGDQNHDGGFGGGGAGVNSSNPWGCGGGGYSGGGNGGSGNGGGGGGSFIVSTASKISTSDGNYDGQSTFNGSPITNLYGFNDGHGYVKITSIVCN